MGEYPKDYKVFVGEGLGTLRAEMIDGRAWFYAVDICKILDLPKMCRLVSTGKITASEYMLATRLAKNGRRKVYLITIPGVKELISTNSACKDEDKLKTFLEWFCGKVTPELCGHKIDISGETIRMIGELPKEEEKATAAIPDRMKEVSMKAAENGPVVGEPAFENSVFDIFDNAEFGSIRTKLINGEPWFCLRDVCKALEIVNVVNVKNRLTLKGVRIMYTLTPGGKQELTFINEANLYKTVFRSYKESAERFTDWVTSEVLPAIRQTGSYQTPPKPLTQLEMMRLQLGMIDNHEDRIKNLEDTMTIDYGQQESLANTVNRSVIDALGGKQSNAYKEIAKKVFAECNHDLKTYFNVNARNNVPRKRYDEAIEYAKNWKPCTNTLMLIRGCNAQMSF